MCGKMYDRNDLFRTGERACSALNLINSSVLCSQHHLYLNLLDTSFPSLVCLLLLIDSGQVALSSIIVINVQGKMIGMGEHIYNERLSKAGKTRPVVSRW